MTPFTIHFEQAQFDDLRRRLDAARLPPGPAELGRELGTNGDDLCDAFTLYWMTNTAAMSIRAYHANSFTLPPLGKIAAPVAIAAFPHDVLPVPREWIERNYRVVRYTEMPRGGHFTALEQPREFAEDLAAFAESL